MKFIVFSVYVWVLAIFHLWEHRRFEADLRSRSRGDVTTDWRLVEGTTADTLHLKRAFRVTRRSDMVRYGAPVAFFFVWLVVFHSWWPALAYLVMVAGKWACVTTALHIPTASYRVMICGRSLFTGNLAR